MEYLIPIVLVLLVVGGFVTFMAFNATNKSGPVADEDEGAPGIGADDTPLGDTSEHAGHQTGAGTTAGGQDAGEAGGTGSPVHSGYAGTSAPGESATDPEGAAHVARPGEGEGRKELEFEGRQPPSAEAEPGAQPAGTQPDAQLRDERRPEEPRRDEPQPERDAPRSERLANRSV